ncbi:MAG: DUF3368 domain-containing protein [Fimbriimonadales bacterium]|nr:DUF3368 domain-containing protein [Fimbriimonadales bacterium]
MLREVRSGIESGKVRPAPLEWLRLINLEPDEIAQAEQLKRRLGEGEAESIAVAVSRGWAFATDDWTARRTALLIGVSITGTIGILAELTRQGVISSAEANAYLQTMVQRGYRSPVNLIEDALQE